MGMSKNGKMMEFPKMIKFSKNGKNDGNSQNGKIPEISENQINAGNFQKLYILGEFLVLGWIPVMD
jgi:hypothetical protein